MGNLQLKMTRKDPIVSETTPRSKLLVWLGCVRAEGPRQRAVLMLCLATVVMGLVTAIVALGFNTRARFFVEGDPTLAFPFIEDSDAIIPSFAVIIIGYFLPMFVVVIFHTFFFRRQFQDCFPIGRQIYNRQLITILWLTLNFLMTVAVTESLKYYDGRNRPDFFAMCNYKGYRTALEQCGGGASPATNWTTCVNNLEPKNTVYQITPGAPGKVEDCLDQDKLKESKSSYPSGHSSVSMSGLGFLAFFFYYSFDVPHTKDWKDVVSTLLQMSLPALCVFGALMVAATRPRDYWHNFSDINMGISIGFVSMVVCGRCWADQMTIPCVEDPRKGDNDRPSKGDLESPRHTVPIHARSPSAETSPKHSQPMVSRSESLRAATAQDSAADEALPNAGEGEMTMGNVNPVANPVANHKMDHQAIVM